ncbi:MAG: O-antigen ligase family protein [Bacteroidales bacterium]|nr:O-antigen ligase family protein [Bacteroidales bacterium]
MTSQASIRPYLNQAYLLGLMMMAVGLTLSPFLMGMANFWLVIVWVVEGFCTKSFNNKLSRFWHNKAAVLLVAFYLMHVVGLLWTSDFQYAMKDLRVKLPILVLPFVMSSMAPLDRKRFDLLMQVYVLSVFVATLFSFTAYLKHDYEDVREISRFISHIRFCLHIAFSIAVVGWYMLGASTGSATRKTKAPEPVEGPTTSRFVWPNRMLQMALILWFVYQIYIFESLSGYVALAAVAVVSAVYAFLHWQKARGWRIAIGVMALALVVVGALVLHHAVKPLLQVEKVDFATLDQKTAQGNDYWHDTIHNPVEDGKYVGLYYCRKELQEAWPQRSSLPLDGLTSNGEDLEATLARYLTSKDLRKDAEGVMALTDVDIRNIEQGVPNYNNWKHPGLRARLSSTLFEYYLYRRYNNPNGGSFSQRIEFTRASFHIIGQYLLFGVGTGDVPQAFSEAYDEIHSPLKEEFRFRAHNQYLAIAVAFGLLGLALFLVVLLYPWLASRRHRTYLYTVFLGIILLSMLAEDTLETQAGASLFAFFEALLLFAVPEE